jgi:hypothetical protein
VPEVDDTGVAAPLGARRVVSRPPDEPPVEQWRREGLADGAPAGPDVNGFAAPPAAPTPTLTPTPAPAPTPAPPVPPVIPVAPVPPVDEPRPTAPSAPSAPTAAAPPPFDPPPADEPTRPGGADDFADLGPLPTRVPGQHLSHHPLVADAAVDADADPMRPYRVHELLTRHAQGKRRGQTEQDDITTDGPSSPTDPTIDANPEMTVPDAFGHAQEDGR